MSLFRKLSRRHTSPRHVGQVALATAFLIVICLPAVRTVLDPSKSRLREGWEENRPLPRFEWRLKAMLSFPRAFADYFQFHFGYRSNLISMHTRLVGEALHASTSQKVLEGKDGWLFLAEAGSIEDYRGLLPFSPRDLARWQQALESRHDWLAGQGIHYLFVICPDKHTVYPEYMPDRVNRVGARTRLDQLVQYMKEHSGVEILDLRPALKALKKEHLCYQPQESHWNDVGAFAAYQQIAARLRWWYPDLRVADMKDCTIFQRKNTETDLLRLQGKTNLITVMDSVRPNNGFAATLKLDPNYHDASRFQVRHSWRAHAPAGKLLMIHDSFGIPLVPFLAEHAREGWYVWSKGGESLSEDVRTFQPDVVIEEVVERALCGREPSPVDVAVFPAGKPDPEQRHDAPPAEPHS